ncbi:g478 [Coccomyxa elongata]
MGKVEETTEHWLRREREKEWMSDGKLDSQLLGLDRDVELWRDSLTCAPRRVTKETWRTVSLSMSDLTKYPANLDMNETDMNETRRVKTLEAMARLGLQGRQLYRGHAPVLCTDVGLDSDFEYLVDAVPEEMLKAAAENEDGLTTIAYASPDDPALFLETDRAKLPQYWVDLGSRLFDSCGIAAGALQVSPLSSDVMRIVVPYHRSRRAAPHKGDSLLTKSKAFFADLCRYKGREKMEKILEDSDFVDADKILHRFYTMP